MTVYPPFEISEACFYYQEESGKVSCQGRKQCDLVIYFKTLSGIDSVKIRLSYTSKTSELSMSRDTVFVIEWEASFAYLRENVEIQEK